MVDIDVIYEGGLHCAATHEPSSAKVATDAPVDNHGRGESFSPTDLVATGLGTCMATVMGLLARSKQWNLDGSRIHVKKEMTKTGARRIARLPVRIEFANTTADLDAEARGALEHAANTCPVRLSIHEAIDVPVEFVWPAKG
jgi:putative redox protein